MAASSLFASAAERRTLQCVHLPTALKDKQLLQHWELKLAVHKADIHSLFQEWNCIFGMQFLDLSSGQTSCTKELVGVQS